MSTASLTHTQRATESTGTILPIVLFVLGSPLMVLHASVTGRVTTQILFGSLALFLLGLAAALSMAKGQERRRSLAAGQLGPYFGLSTAVVSGLANLILLGNPSAEQAALIARDSRGRALSVLGVAVAMQLVAGRKGDLPTRAGIG